MKQPKLLMECIVVQYYTRSLVLYLKIFSGLKICVEEEEGGTKTPLNIRVLPTCKKNLDAAEAS